MIKSLMFKKNISLFCFMFVNFIFGVKYFSRVTNDYYILLSLLLVLFYISIWKLKYLLLKLDKYLNVINFIIVIVFISIFIFIFKKVPVDTLKIDRWSVITSFWENYFNDKYVYFAKSFDNNYPGPMPFYFILALPFYLIGELGYFSLLGLLTFFTLLKRSKISSNYQSILILLILGSTFYLHEIIGRSNIFLNSTLILIVLNFYFDRKELNCKKIILSGILIGLTISTRNVLVIPFIIAFIFELKTKSINILQLINLGLIAFSTFALTFAPFIWNHFSDFLTMNPFIIQSSALIPFKYTLVFIALSFVFGFICKTLKDVYFLSGVNLFVSIVIYYFYTIKLVGFHQAFFGSTADITYFILCIPFFLYYLALDSKKVYSN